MIANYDSKQRGSIGIICGKTGEKRGKLDIRVPNSLYLCYTDENFLCEENIDLIYHVKGNLHTPVPQTAERRLYARATRCCRVAKHCRH